MRANEFHAMWHTLTMQIRQQKDLVEKHEAIRSLRFNELKFHAYFQFRCTVSSVVRSLSNRFRSSTCLPTRAEQLCAQFDLMFLFRKLCVRVCVFDLN